jgi:plasmid maintenance system antidote protein VapI
LESFSGPEAVTFEVLRSRLIWFVNDRISNGDLSERGLARILQVSQPQIHNVLKGARKLTPELADRLLRCFGMTVIDLLHRSDLRQRFGSTLGGAESVRTQETIGAHIEIHRFPSASELARKRPARETLPDLSRTSKTA